jgi:hypothetical protein
MHALIESHREQLPSLARRRGSAVIPGPETEHVLLAHRGECIERVREYTADDRSCVHGHLGIDFAAVWLVVDQDLPPPAAAPARVIAGTCP